MKTLLQSLLAITFSLLAICSLNAQMTDGKARFGLKLGVNGANLYDDSQAEDIKSRLGITGGGFVQIPLGKGRFALRPELLFTTKGAAYDFVNGKRPDIKLNYLELPISLEYRLLGFINLHAGASASLLATADGKIEGVSFNFDKEQFERFDYGWHLGGGLDLGPLGVHLRVSRGLNEISNRVSLDEFVGKLKNAAWALTLSYGF